MSDERAWRRLIGPQDALLWWLVPQVGRRAQESATAALRWADGNLRGPDDLARWERRTEAVPGILPGALAAYLSAVPLLLGALPKPASAASVERALQGTPVDRAPPGLPSGAMPAPPARPGGPPPPSPPPGGPPAPSGPGGPPPWRGVRLTPDMRRAIRWAHDSAAQHVTSWADTVRADLRWQVAVGIRSGRTARQQATVLRDRYRQWGADFLRVALTEAHESMMAGRLLGYPDGAKVRAILAPGACPDCRRLLDGKTFTVRHEPGDPLRDMWPGKSNAGLQREKWTPTIPNHPRCRCCWIVADFGRLIAP